MTVNWAIPSGLRDPDTPDDVKIRLTARKPEGDARLGIRGAPTDGSGAKHRLVAVGDSLTHGFQNLAIFKTDLSYPALIARELGCYDTFRHPEYPGHGGLPLNVEYVLHKLEGRFPGKVHWWQTLKAARVIVKLVNATELYWERGGGAKLPAQTEINHNLGVYGWDLCDVLRRSSDYEAGLLAELLATGPTTIGVNLRAVPERLTRYLSIASRRAGMRVLESARDSVTGRSLTPLEAAHALGLDGGIETLIVFVGANNALRTVLELGTPRWSGPDYDELAVKDKYTVWQPSHFLAEYERITRAVKDINAAHVVFCTVPHITIAPLARGVGSMKAQRDLPLGANVPKHSRYFDYYTRPWISDKAFHAQDDEHITGNQARAIDSAIDQYNDGIVELVRDGRRSGADWLLLDTAGLLDRLACRRYIEDPDARPSWWEPYPLPPPLDTQRPALDSRFFLTGPTGVRTQGGLIALDGIHPTTVAYGLLAEELIKVMRLAGVQVPAGGDADPPRATTINFRDLLAEDTLITSPPHSLSSDLSVLAWLDEILELRKCFQPRHATS